MTFWKAFARGFVGGVVALGLLGGLVSIASLVERVALSGLRAE